VIQYQYCIIRTHFSQHNLKNGKRRNKIGVKQEGHAKHNGINTGTSNLVLATELENRDKAKSEVQGRNQYNEAGSEIIPLAKTGTI